MGNHEALYIAKFMQNLTQLFLSISVLRLGDQQISQSGARAIVSNMKFIQTLDLGIL